MTPKCGACCNKDFAGHHDATAVHCAAQTSSARNNDIKLCHNIVANDAAKFLHDALQRCSCIPYAHTPSIGAHFRQHVHNFHKIHLHFVQKPSL